MQPNVCLSENGVKCFVFLLESLHFAPLAGSTNPFANHIPKGELFYKTSDSRWWSLHLLPSPASLPLPHSVLFISSQPQSLCCYFFWQGKLSSQGFFKYLLFCLNFSFIMRQRRGYNAPHWLEKLTDKWVRQRAEGRATQGLNFSFNLLPEATLVQIPVISPAAVEFYIHLLLIIHHKL